MSLIFPDIDLLMTQEMRERLPEGIYIGRKVPSEVPDPAVILTRRGGDSFTRVVDRVRVAVNVYAGTDKQAGDLAREVRSHIHALSGEGVIKNCRTSGPAEVSTDTRLSRVYFNAEFTIRGKQI